MPTGEDFRAVALALPEAEERETCAQAPDPRLRRVTTGPYDPGVPYYALTRTRGPAWDRSRPMLEQDQWAAHAAFMNALVDDGFVVVGGPIGDGERTLLMVDAPSEEAIHDRLATDPWTPMGLLSIVDVQPWQILLGRDA